MSDKEKVRPLVEKIVRIFRSFLENLYKYHSEENYHIFEKEKWNVCKK